MKCPHCLKSIHYEDAADAISVSDEDDAPGYAARLGFCPSCFEPIVFLDKGTYAMVGQGYARLNDVQSSVLIFPQSSQRELLPDEVTGVFRADYDEAAAVLKASPKASAAISRRLLQHTLREHFKITPGNLAREIQSFLEMSGVPSHVADAVDAVRLVGNLAAHPSKDQHTGEIVDVEPHEAEWLLDVLDTLFDFAFVQPVRAKKRKDELERKLAKISKKGRAGAP